MAGVFHLEGFLGIHLCFVFM
uniref:Uncharacterized protein n=1 Tax=Rhizophora mucronata TaxID=61149 RepID=A0A2P2QNX0_RHIMU